MDNADNAEARELATKPNCPARKSCGVCSKSALPCAPVRCGVALSDEDLCTRFQCCRLPSLVALLCCSVMVTMTVLPWATGVCRRRVRLVPIQAHQQEEGPLREPEELGHLPPDQRHHHHWQAHVRLCVVALAGSAMQAIARAISL
jgi:hypothetical protein